MSSLHPSWSPWLTSFFPLGGGVSRYLVLNGSFSLIDLGSDFCCLCSFWTRLWCFFQLLLLTSLKQLLPQPHCLWWGSDLCYWENLHARKRGLFPCSVYCIFSPLFAAWLCSHHCCPSFSYYTQQPLLTIVSNMITSRAPASSVSANRIIKDMKG